VLDGDETLGCPYLAASRRCLWPGRLGLDLRDGGGAFTLDVVADAPVDVPLPGDASHEPLSVTVDGRPATVSAQTRSVRVERGAHRIAGRFVWARLPEALDAPTSIGLVDVTLRGEALRSPPREPSGRVLLRGGTAEASEADSLSVEVFRRIEDGVPVRVETRIVLRASGKPREVDLGVPALAGTVLTAVSGALPARIDGTGHLHAQVRPGEFTLTLLARTEAASAGLTAPSLPPPWPEQEVWSFLAAPSVRSVRPDGAPGVDPSRAGVPTEWSNDPAFRLDRGAALQFVELRRGLGDPPPDRITVSRQLWLREDGETLVALDDLRGSVNAGGRVGVAAGGVLGRARVGAESRVITSSDGMEGGGVEVRDHALNMQGLSTWTRGAALPAVGWNKDADSLSANLSLPPGWTLLAVPGTDRASGAWIDRWTLLDVFFVLVISLAAGQLLGVRWGVALLALLSLGWHEPDAPRFFWLGLLAVLALRRAIRNARVEALLRVTHGALLVGLALVVVAFAWQQSRVALFPQLGIAGAPQDMFTWAKNADMAQMAAPEAPAFDVPAEQAAGFADSAVEAVPQRGALSDGRRMSQIPTPGWKGEGVGGSYDKVSVSKRAARVDPQAVVQTGPGQPRWQWASHRLEWTGPVGAEHTIRLLVLPPLASALLSFLRIALAVLAAMRIASLRLRPPPAAAAAPMLGLALLGLTGDAHAAPSSDVLDELRERLLRAPACNDRCATARELTLEAEGGSLRIEAEVHAATSTAWELPGPLESWAAARVEVDGVETKALLRLEGTLFVRVPEGIHRVVAEGPAREQVSLRLPAGTGRASFRSEDWTVEGLVPGEPAPESVILTRSAKAESEVDAAREDVDLPVWALLRRELDLGVTWIIHGSIERDGAGGRALSVRVPLLAGESVTTPGIPVENGEAIIALQPSEMSRSWESTLPIGEAIALRATEGRRFTEVWSLDCSPLWSCKAAGLPEARTQSDSRWFPQWLPWPGEALTIAVSRPPPVEGATTTLDAVKLTVTPGRRVDQGALELDVISSQGGTLALGLPAGADVQSLTVGGSAVPFQRDGTKASFSLLPGTRKVAVAWTQPSQDAVLRHGPAIDVSLPASNVGIDWVVPDGRWLLWVSGPRWGPVVTIWQYVVVLVLVALLLGRFARTPLRTFDWFLLGLGLSQVPLPAAALVPISLIGLSMRRGDMAVKPFVHDVIQVALAGLSFGALIALYAAVHSGLLLSPDMQVEGGGSYGSQLRWFQDLSGSTLPDVTVLSLPIWAWRVTMLLWALWLALRLLRLLPWAWQRISDGSLLRWPAALRASWKQQDVAAGKGPGTAPSA
jgi:hypothetical protein